MKPKRSRPPSGSRVPVPRATPSPRHPAAASGEPAGGRPELGPLAHLGDVDVEVTLEWGRSQLTVDEAGNLDEGALLRLEQRAAELVDVRINGTLFARGKLVLVGDTYGVQLVELLGDA